MGKESSAVYSINYIVWCPKYRKNVLEGEVKEFIEDQIQTIAATKGCEIFELRLCRITFISLSRLRLLKHQRIEILKGVTGLRLFKKYPELRKEYWGRAYMVSELLYRDTWACICRDDPEIYRGTKDQLIHLTS
ncbi:MAG: transposase [Candidatus Methanomethylicaceae archaeon]